MEQLKEALSAAGIAYKENEPLCAHCTFRIGGPADLFVLPENEEQLCAAIRLAKEAGVRSYLLGNGSNILFEDAGYRGAVINVSAMKSGIGVIENISFPGKDPALTYDAVVVGAGQMLSSLCMAALENSLTGLEFAYGIPGTVGGAVYMNAGAYGGEMRDVLTAVTFLDETGTVRTLPAKELELGYRTSIFERTGWHVLSAQLHLVPGDPAQIEAAMQELMARRVEKQPLEYPSAGSAFKRPQGAFAGALIQQCGLRGARVGGAAISEKHCGFIVNLGGATCADVLALADLVCKTVKEQTGYTLEKEIRVVE